MLSSPRTKRKAPLVETNGREPGEEKTPERAPRLPGNPRAKGGVLPFHDENLSFFVFVCFVPVSPLPSLCPCFFHRNEPKYFPSKAIKHEKSNPANLSSSRHHSGVNTSRPLPLL